MKYRLILNSLLAASLLLAIVATAAAQPAAEAPMTNDEVIMLTQAGLSPSIIIAKIRSGRSDFNLSTDSLIKLKQAGVTDEIVGAMLEAKSGKTVTAGTPLADPNDPMTKHNYGLYLYEDLAGTRKMTQLK